MEEWVEVECLVEEAAEAVDQQVVGEELEDKDKEASKVDGEMTKRLEQQEAGVVVVKICQEAGVKHLKVPGMGVQAATMVLLLAVTAHLEATAQEVKVNKLDKVMLPN